jgi:hypothetical protein
MGSARPLRLVATAKGIKILQEGRRRRVELLAHVLESLTESERQTAAALADFMQDFVRKV